MTKAAKTEKAEDGKPDPFLAAVKLAGEQAEQARKAEQVKADQTRTDIARDAVQAVLVLPDGTALNLADVGLEPVPDVALPVWARDGYGLAYTTPRDGPPGVRLVRMVDGRWTELGAVTDLADVARLLL